MTDDHALIRVGHAHGGQGSHDDFAALHVQVGIGIHRVFELGPRRKRAQAPLHQHQATWMLWQAGGDLLDVVFASVVELRSPDRPVFAIHREPKLVHIDHEIGALGVGFLRLIDVVDDGAQRRWWGRRLIRRSNPVPARPAAG